MSNVADESEPDDRSYDQPPAMRGRRGSSMIILIALAIVAVIAIVGIVLFNTAS